MVTPAETPFYDFYHKRKTLSGRKGSMSNSESEVEAAKIPAAQKVFDRPFFWLIAGFVIMLLFYTFWGMYEIFNMPTATLP